MNNASYDDKISLSSEKTHVLLEEWICKFDSVLDRIESFMPNDLEVRDRVCEARDALFKLLCQMRGIRIEVFASQWFDSYETQTPADLFWDHDNNSSSSSCCRPAEEGKEKEAA